MKQGVYPLAVGMMNQLAKTEMTANNLANMNTVGFKSDNVAEGSFRSALEQAAKTDKNTTAVSEVYNTLPSVNKAYTNYDLGALNVTGNKFDFAINKEDLFFKVKDGDKTFLTRDGNFMNSNGFLTTKDGMQVLGKNNKPLLVEENIFRKHRIIPFGV